MHYLPDAALFLGLVALLVLSGWAVSPGQRTFEASFVPGAALLGAYAWFIWVVSSLWRWQSFLLLLPLLLIPLVVWKRQSVVEHWRRFVTSLKSLAGTDRWLAWYLVAVCALAFVLTLAPPSGADYDSLTYHLAVPAQYLRVGKVVEFQYDHHSYFPFTLEMLYMAGLALRGAVFAKMFHWLMLPLGALALLALGKQALNRRAGLLAAALYVSMPLILGEASTAYIDLGFAAFAFLAVLCFFGFPQSTRGWNWLYCGAFCGFCLGSKYFGALIFGFLAVWFLASQSKAKTLTARNLALFAIPALVFGMPWYGRNFLWTGNPVFPFAYGVFGGKGWTAAMAAAYDVDLSQFGFGKTPSDLISLPWRVAMTPMNAGRPFWPFLETGVDPAHKGLFEGGLFITLFPGPAIIALGLPSLFLREKPRPVQLAMGLFLFLTLFWSVTSQQIRYLIPALGMLALVGGWGMAQAAPRFPVARRVGGVCLTLWLLFAPAWILWNASTSFGVISGAQTPEDYLLRSFSGYDAMSWASQNTPQNSKFAVYGEPRCFYLDRTYFWADDAHNNLIDYDSLKNGTDLARALKKLGVTHVLWNTDFMRNGGAFGPPPTLINDAIERGELNLLVDKRGYRIYLLNLAS